MSEYRQHPDVMPADGREQRDRRATVTPRGAALLLALVVLSLTALSLLGQLAVHYLPDFVLRDRLAATFSVDKEGNIPTLYSTLAILSCAFLLRVIARAERAAARPFARHWTLMAFVFLELAADEYLTFHEEISDRLDLSRFTEFSWVVIGLGIAMVLASGFSLMVAQLPPPVRRLVLVAGSLYLSGAIVVETLGGHYVAVWGYGSMKYVLCATAEEFLEMLGIVAFIYALLRFLTTGGREVVLALHLRAAPDRAAR